MRKITLDFLNSFLQGIIVLCSICCSTVFADEVKEDNFESDIDSSTGIISSLTLSYKPYDVFIVNNKEVGVVGVLANIGYQIHEVLTVGLTYSYGTGSYDTVIPVGNYGEVSFDDFGELTFYFDSNYLEHSELRRYHNIKQHEFGAVVKFEPINNLTIQASAKYRILNVHLKGTTQVFRYLMTRTYKDDGISLTQTVYPKVPGINFRDLRVFEVNIDGNVKSVNAMAEYVLKFQNDRFHITPSIEVNYILSQPNITSHKDIKIASSKNMFKKVLSETQKGHHIISEIKGDSLDSEGVKKHRGVVSAVDEVLEYLKYQYLGATAKLAFDYRHGFTIGGYGSVKFIHLTNNERLFPEVGASIGYETEKFSIKFKYKALANGTQLSEIDHSLGIAAKFNSERFCVDIDFGYNMVRKLSLPKNKFEFTLGFGFTI